MCKKGHSGVDLASVMTLKHTPQALCAAGYMSFGGYAGKPSLKVSPSRLTLDTEVLFTTHIL